MTQLDPKRLKDEAGSHVHAGRWEDALDAYLQLARLEPDSGLWLLKAGEIYRKLGNDERAIAAFDSAAQLYSSHGFLVKAIAVCKLILEIDPLRRAAQDRLASLHAAAGRPGSAGGARRDPPLTRPPLSAAPPTSPSELPRFEEDGPIADSDIESLIPDARPAEETLDPDHCIEIPLDFEDVELLAEEPERELARSVLPKTPLFSALDEDSLTQVIEAVRLVELEAGQVLFRQGVRGDALYVIAEGEVAILSETGETELELGRLGEGSFFGEIALLTAQPRNATVRAVSATRLLGLDRAVVNRLCARSPDVAKVLLRFVRERLLGTLMETNPLFTSFSADERFSLIERFDVLQLDAGAVILEEGKHAPGLFILLTGRAIGTIEGNPVYELGPGDIMGEVSLLTHGNAIATVRTQTRSMALELPRDEFQDVIMTHPQVLEYAGGIAEERRKLVEAWREGKAIYHEGRLRMV